MAKDIHHQCVKEALIKEGWKITNDPYFLSVLDSPVYEVDLAAEKLIAAEKEDSLTGSLTKIAIEIKSFVASSIAHEFNRALGQYLGYVLFMSIKEPERKLFLAVPDEVYYKFFTKEATILTLSHYHIHLIVFNIETNTIIQWLKN